MLRLAPVRLIASRIVEFYRRERRDLPWRRTRDPYAIWVSEIMLQQTRVATVIPYWERWMARFPSVGVLAAAPLDDVLAAWAGLGYYSRARNLHAGARWVANERGGELPRTAADLRAVPGIGPYTAGAIASIAHGERAPLVDGNVARVLARVCGVEDDVKSTAGQKKIWALAGELVAALPPELEPGDLNQGVMELGATVCTPTAPTCLTCPLSGPCVARAAARQDELPRVPARKAAADLRELASVALWIERRGALLFARRPAGGLYGGLWELPQGDDAGAAARRVGVKLRGKALALGEHRQVLSHRRLRIALARATVVGTPRVVDGYTAVRWCSPAAASEELGVSSATSALLALGKGRRKR
jgi:A/G-specific adenine glycosylase